MVVADPDEGGRDRDLMTRCQAGELAAFGKLYGLHYGRLVRYCQRRVHDNSAAEEIAQEAFIRAYRALPRLDGHRSFYPWLTGIAGNLIRNHARDQARRAHVTLDSPGWAPSAEWIVLQRFAAQQLEVALGRLTDRHREVLRLRDLDGLAYQQIAAHMGLSEAAVTSLVHRARQALRRECVLIAGRDYLAALPGWAGLLAGGRRLRDRLVPLWTSGTPLEALGLPALLIVVIVGTAVLQLGPGAHLEGEAAGGSSASLAPEHGSAGWASPAADPLSAAGSQAAGGSAAELSPLPGHAVRLRDHMVSTRAQDTHQGRDWARRSPIHAEVGPAFIGVDPYDVVPTAERTLGRPIGVTVGSAPQGRVSAKGIGPLSVESSGDAARGDVWRRPPQGSDGAGRPVARRATP